MDNITFTSRIKPVTRAEFIKLIVEANGGTDNSAMCEFSDVAEDDWFNAAVATGYKNKLITGDGNLFRPNDNITRDSMAIMFYRAAGAPAVTQAQLKAVTDELNGLKQANALRDLREKVSKETGVPASLLTAETEEACKAQAAAIRDYAKPSGYPPVRDGGEVHPANATATRDQFADWLNQSFK